MLVLSDDFFFSKLTFQKKSYRNTFRVSKDLDPYQAMRGLIWILTTCNNFVCVCVWGGGGGVVIDEGVKKTLKGGHYQPASQTFKWCFAGMPMMAKLCVFSGDLE